MSFLVILTIGVILGFLSGMGVGGGSLLIVWLTIVLKMDYATAKGLNLLFFLPPALISTIGNFTQKKLPWRTVIPAAVSGCITAALFTSMSSQWDTRILRKIFGVLLLYTAFQELRNKKAAEDHKGT